MAPLHMILALFRTLDDTKGRAIVQQASASYYKGVYPYKLLGMM